MDSFLFNPCGLLNCDNCSQLSNLNLLKSKIFRQTSKNDTLKISEPRYCSKVLHGNWFEERAQYKAPPDEWVSSYNVLFKPYSSENFNVTSETREAAKKLKDRSKGVTREELLEHHGDAYHNNFSTAYDLSYRVLPRGLSGPPLRKYNACKRTYVPEQDLAKNFGNQYGYGYKEYIQRRDEELIEEAKDLPRSHYRCDYTEKKIPTDKRYPRRRADMNKPDLRHLNIDLDTKWGRLFTHGYHRLNILQQKIH
ncbi:cilia- and flagella-associated protein 107-like isoform X1 [Diachasmimorpha longicaudata]|uniref:cilia- and flagella-associated protein 107-like isoform X1 n=1 Tax=Diachasmimorpha longicaudata TaxID=58733 RepID=UPI0030B8DFA6